MISERAYVVNWWRFMATLVDSEMLRYAKSGSPCRTVFATSSSILQKFRNSLNQFKILLASKIWLPVQNGLRNYFILNALEVRKFLESIPSFLEYTEYPRPANPN